RRVSLGQRRGQRPHQHWDVPRGRGRRDDHALPKPRRGLALQVAGEAAAPHGGVHDARDPDWQAPLRAGGAVARLVPHGAGPGAAAAAPAGHGAAPRARVACEPGGHALPHHPAVDHCLPASQVDVQQPGGVDRQPRGRRGQDSAADAAAGDGLPREAWSARGRLLDCTEEWPFAGVTCGAGP
ncbi:unnamed protein product, partial [Prorocentrum cordatum]